MQNKLSASACVRFGWETFKKRPWFLIATQLLGMAANQVVGLVFQFVILIVTFLTMFLLPDAVGALFTVVAFAALFVAVFAISFLVQIGLTNVSLKAASDVSTVQLGDMWAPTHFWKYVGVTLLSGLGILLGLALFIIPGFIFAVAWMFACLFVIDKGMRPIAALKESWGLTKGNRLPLFGLLILVVLINFHGVLCLFVGVLVSAPVSMIALAHAYKTLQGRGGDESIPSPAVVV